MERYEIYIIAIIVLIVIAFIVSFYVFNIYEVEYKVSNYNLYADSQSVTSIKTIPINGFGFKAPFRKSKAYFTFIEGRDKIEIVEENNEEGFIIIKTKNIPGNIKIRVTCEHALFPTNFEFEIKANTA